MFDPAPNCDTADRISTDEIRQFYQRVHEYALRYGVYHESRIGLIDHCCDYLENLQKEQKKAIWSRKQREPIEEFQNVFQLLIYAVADRGLLFDSAGYFRNGPPISADKTIAVHADQTLSVIQYRDFAFAMRRRNFAHLELINLRKHLDEHYKQEQNYFSNTHERKRAEVSAEVRQVVDMVHNVALTYSPAAIEQIAALRDRIQQDRFLKKVEPFIIFMILSGKTQCSDICTTSDVKSLLKPNKSKFSGDDVSADCALFTKIMKWYTEQPNAISVNEHWLFDPYLLLHEFQHCDGLEMTTEEQVSLAHLCEDCFQKPMHKKNFAQYKQKLHGVEIGEVFKALFLLFDAQTHSSQDKIQPRGWKNIMAILQKAKILPMNLAPFLKASELLAIIGERYFLDQYSFAWETFWLITQYTPPPLFDWKPNFGGRGLAKRPYELYAVCDDFLTTVSESIHTKFIKYAEHISLPPALRFDIAKVRRIFADSKRTTDFRQQLLQDMQSWQIVYSSKALPEKLADYCLNEYNQIASNSKDANLKSLRQYPEIMKYAMADEVMRQLCAETYAKVFHLLVSMNQYLWPIT